MGMESFNSPPQQEEAEKQIKEQETNEANNEKEAEREKLNQELEKAEKMLNYYDRELQGSTDRYNELMTRIQNNDDLEVFKTRHDDILRSEDNKRMIGQWQSKLENQKAQVENIEMRIRQLG